MSWIWLVAVAVVGIGLALVALVGRDEVGDRKGTPSDDSIARWLADLRSERAAVRADAARKLAPSPEEGESPELYAAADRIAPALMAVATDEDVNVRKWVAWSVAGMVRHEKVPADQGLPILMRALEDPDPTVRTYGAFALEKVGRAGKPAIDALERAKEADPKRDVRIAAAAAARALRRFQ